MATKFPSFSQDLAQDPTTRRIWYGIATVHDFETHDGMTEENLYQKIFATHFGHLSIIFLWAAGLLFHVAWQGNFEQWIQDPLTVRPIAHAIWDPQLGDAATQAFTQAGASGPVDLCYSGVYHWWYTIGMRTNGDLYSGSIFLMVVASVMLFAGWLHLQPKFRPSLAWFRDAESQMNHHLAVLFGASSLGWTGHLIHVAIPEARGQHVGWDNFLSTMPHPAGLAPFFTGRWAVYAQNPDTAGHIFGTGEGAGTAILTFMGGFHPQTEALWLTDIAHHHLAIAVLYIVAGHMYRTQFGIGHSMKEIMDAHRDPWYGATLQGLYDTYNESLHFQLAFHLAALGVITEVVAQHMYSLPSYAFISQDYVTQAALYTHHQYIGGFLALGAYAHGGIFFVRDYDPERNKGNALSRLLEHKEVIISHLSWVSMLLGFHTLDLYVHNDVVVAFGTPEKQILPEPIFAEWVQACHGKLLLGLDKLLSNPQSIASTAWPNYGDVWLPGWLDAVNGANTPFLNIGPGDFLVHHGIAFSIHVTVLICVKGCLDARGSKLMPDKKDFGYSFPCDGPGRGGTCDISAWDSFYLATFWMLNTIGWVTFYFNWKQLSVWSGNIAQFNNDSTYLMGWLRDYLWGYSAQLINGYTPFGVNSLSVWAWIFLLGHLCWATGFLFLISWRGYWQELIETLVWAHQRTPLANLVMWKDKPVALSIVQGRLVGLVHFAVGYFVTYGAFVIGATAPLS
ncbi:photosystem I core protein PsaB [Acaryochloris sp. IP29b_bin.137]|uniref:photosystem I core protein PsaB n=1 Tax=Acaryochloris sp. IP29b_bin.137 TaxID=2969217 RepID=UPI0026137846|nr:photosystem I core protein PsaB [Acaryochloris sp. IP29b_bin.137]